MRRWMLLIAMLMVGLLIACGGGDDDSVDDGPGGSDAETTSASGADGDSSGSENGTATATGGGSTANGGGSSGGAQDEFCVPDNLDVVFDNVDFSDLSNLEENFKTMSGALDQWADRAPREIRDDVEVIASTIRGFIELLEEHDYNFLAMAVAAEADPRFAALDSAEFNAASDRLAEYCGYDIEPPSTGLLPSGGGGNGAGGITTTLPNDFPPELVPPDSVVNFAGNIGPGLAAEFTSAASVAEVLAFYEDVLGEATVRDSESVIWSLFVDDSLKTVTVTGTDGQVDIAVALVGS